MVEKQVNHYESQQFDYKIEIPQAVSRKYYCNNTNPNQQHNRDNTMISMKNAKSSGQLNAWKRIN